MIKLSIQNNNSNLYNNWLEKKYVLDYRFTDLNLNSFILNICKNNELIIISDKTYTLNTDTITSNIGAGTILVLDKKTNKCIQINPHNVKSLGMFGSILDISRDGNILLVTGNYNKLPNNKNKDVIYIYKYPFQNIDSFDILDNINTLKGESYGNAISISEDGKTFVISAINKKINNLKSTGCIFIYKELNNNIEEIQVITPPKQNIKYFGTKIKISGNGNRLFITAKNNEIKYSSKSTNVIYYYKRDQLTGIWEYINEINVSMYYYIESFGYSIDCNDDGTKLIVSTPYGFRRRSNDIKYGSGWVNIYSLINNIWGEQTIFPIPSFQYYRFGNSVSMSSSGNRVLITGLNNDPLLGGIFYLYELISGEYSLLPLLDYGSINTYKGNAATLSKDGKTIVTNISEQNNDYRDSLLEIRFIEEL